MSAMAVLLLVAGLALLLVGGEALVRGASTLAASWGVSRLMIGLTIVAFGTSAPELAVSLGSELTGREDMALGNVLGSNIFNVLFILGASALIAPLVVSRRVVQVEVPVMIAVSAGALLLALDGRLGVVDGAALVLTIVVYTGWLLRSSRQGAGDEAAPAAMPGGRIGMALAIGVGLVLLVAGARALVDGASTLARAFGVSEAVIGLTIVAAGTSLPEVAASLVATFRGQRDIAVGNVLGSNVFNLTAILGTATLWGGGMAVSPGLLGFDFVVALAVAAACLPIFYTGHRIARWEGVVFLAYYVIYVAYLLLAAGDHPALPQVQSALLYFALPLTVVTLALFAWRQRRAGPA